MHFRDLVLEFSKLNKSREGVDSAQAATASLHKDWLDINSEDVSVQKGLSNLFSSRTQKEKLENEKTLKAQEALQKYRFQGEPRKSDHNASLMPVSRSEMSLYDTSAATEPSTIPQLHPGHSSGQANIVRLGLD